MSQVNQSVRDADALTEVLRSFSFSPYNPAAPQQPSSPRGADQLVDRGRPTESQMVRPKMATLSGTCGAS